ncbi:MULTISPECIES: hypothetical protein [Salegentibacter]|jgi:thiamine transporter ThiT|uniref:Uncharacterized protein n=1 Tax=Salegentibacter agarivorans TaxID=345907 RepID=A0A1I2KW74_9FLAO|nr:MULTISPECIES: hypothetical protein [Salegentibacter]SFF71322.1 hypothetical protein SAMN04488033_10614 [Salegentibacter agarivorans]|tara:strand:+ start:244 stop:399 length:156 start_codon:yes stop_codon:yes gene_type:complete
MNKVRITGLGLLAIGISLISLFEGDLAGIAAGLLTGLGIGLLVTGRLRFQK